MIAYNTYSTTMFNPDRMRKVLETLAEKMPQWMGEYDFDTIAITGKSGLALGFALQLYVPGLHVVAVRKGESTHGDMVEGDGHSFTRYAFFDDFVQSGDTKRRVHAELCNYAHNRAQTEPVLAAVIEYDHLDLEF